MADRPAYVIVIGGGKVGYYLAHRLLGAGYEVALIEKDRTRAASISAQLGSCACLVGDGDEMAFLATSGIERADVVAAVTGDDEDNLVACQLAKRQFKVPHTVARVNNPSNVQLFQRLGVDVAVSATELILNEIDSALATHSDAQRLPLEGTRSGVVRLSVPPGGGGRQAAETPELREERLLLLLRQGKEIPLDSALEVGDQLVLFTSKPLPDLTIQPLAEPARVSG